MLLQFVNALPSAQTTNAGGWCRWQVDVIVGLIEQTAGFTNPVIIEGCIEERSGEWPTEPKDHDPPDSLGVFYYDEDEEEAEYWYECAFQLRDRITKAVDWHCICPDAIKRLASHVGLSGDFHYERQAPPKGVVMTDAEVEEMERRKSDDCDLNLVHLPPTIDLFDPSPFCCIIRGYVCAIAGPLPQGVSLKVLWKPSDQYRSVLTGEPAKVMFGWGLVFPSELRPAALKYADRFRFGAYTLLPHVDWQQLSIPSLKRLLREAGLLGSEDRG